MVPLIWLISALLSTATGNEDFATVKVTENSTSKIWPRIDFDGDGLLEMQEFDFVFFTLDINRDTNITRSEFIRKWNSRYLLHNYRIASKFFAALDITGKGFITYHDIPHLYKLFDLNANGIVDYNEFISTFDHMVSK